jgi:hypothetical protein
MKATPRCLRAQIAALAALCLTGPWPHRDWWGEGDWLIWTNEGGYFLSDPEISLSRVDIPLQRCMIQTTREG